MANTLAARLAARQQMAPQMGGHARGQQPQGFLDRNRNIIEPLIGLGQQGAEAAAQYAQQRYGYQADRAAREANQKKPSTPDEIAEAVKAKQGSLIGSTLQPEAMTGANAQLSDLLKQLSNQKLDRMIGSSGNPTNPELWANEAYQTAEQQQGDQPVPQYSQTEGPKFPWEQFLSQAMNRHGNQIFGRQASGLRMDVDPNWLRNRLAQAAPAAGQAIGALGGGIVGGLYGGPAGAAAGANLGGAGGNIIGQGINQFASTGFESRL